MRLIDADQITDHEIIDYLGIRYASCLPDVRDLLNDQPTIEAVPLSEIYRCIAGHSNYHGDNILAAMTCIAEGKEVKPIQPIEVTRIITLESVSVVRAEWKVNGVNPHNMTIGNWRCTACDGISLKNSNFCPHCGAMMKGSVK